MAKQPKKPQGNSNIPLNSPNLTPELDSSLSKSRDKKEYNPTPKSKQQIDKEHYQKNKEHKKQQRRQRYQQQKLQAELSTQQQLSKYYTAEAFKVLMPFKEYTELNQTKRQLWQDFNWTLKDCQESVKEGYADVATIMKLEQVANNLVRDYWDTAKSEERQKGKFWNSLDYEEQQRLIKYWGYEKARKENNYLTEEEKLQRQSKEYLKEIELAKFHEERGKVKCSCYECENKREIQKEVKAKWKQELDSYDQKQGSEKEQCPECSKWFKELDEEAGVCRSCKRKYE